MKEDALLNDYYGIDYANWFQNIVTTYAELNSAIGSLQDYKIVDHKVVIGERIIEPDEEKANLVILMNEIIEMLDAKFLEAKDRALEALKESGAAYGTVIYLDVDVDSLMDAFGEILNEENVENYRIESGVTFGDLVNEVVAWHTRNNPQDPAASNVVEVQINAERFFGDISGKNTEDTLDDYVSAHSFITDSFATDEDYVYTDFTSDKDIVLVTYQNAEGKEVKFLINYNIYTVQVDLDDGKDAYTLPKYGYVKIG